MNLPKPNHEKYISAYPFPHIVIDGAMEEHSLNEVIYFWPYKHDSLLKQEDQKFKGHTWNEKTMGARIANFLRNFHSQEFINWLQDLTGIRGLVTDMYYGDGGLHETFRNGRLMVHTDYTKSEKTGLDRVLNVIIYLNRDWKKEYGGNLQLWDRNPGYNGASFIEIEPVFNRMVIFNTSGDSFHGHPEPLKCPKGHSRKSIALYYFINSNKPVDKITNFIDTDKWTLKKAIKLFIPPIVWKILKKA